MSERKTAADRLRDLREAAGKTRQQVTRDLNISERTLIRHENGTTPLSGMHVRAYADYYGVAPSEIDGRVAA